jgi:hypothetical protein
MNDKELNEIGGKLIESRSHVDEKSLADASVDLLELVPAKGS